jgi:hypothetical protein
MLVGCWDARADAAPVAEQPRSVAAYHVALSVAAADHDSRTSCPQSSAHGFPPLKPAQELHKETPSSNLVVARANR